MNTKIYNKIFAAVLLFSSCADLEQTSLSSIDRDNFYKSKVDIRASILTTCRPTMLRLVPRQTLHIYESSQTLPSSPQTSLLAMPGKSITLLSTALM